LDLEGYIDEERGKRYRRWSGKSWEEVTDPTFQDQVASGDIVLPRYARPIVRLIGEEYLADDEVYHLRLTMKAVNPGEEDFVQDIYVLKSSYRTVRVVDFDDDGSVAIDRRWWDFNQRFDFPDDLPP
jgi:hypothetical protein